MRCAAFSRMRRAGAPRAQELCTSSELHEQPQPGGLHGKAHHTPAVAELDQLKDAAKRDRAALVDVFDRVKSSLDDDVDERMVRVAAVTIQTALGEMLSRSRHRGRGSPIT